MYDTNQAAVTTALTSTSTEVFSASTIDSILSLVTTTGDTSISAEEVTVSDDGTLTVTPGTEIAFVTVSGTEQTEVTVDADIPVVLFQSDGDGGVDATFDASAAAGSKALAAAPVQAALGDEIERVIVGTAAADTITILDDKATKVVAGEGDVITAGSGHTIVVAAQGSSTVVGGGDTWVEAVGDDADFVVDVDDGHAFIYNSTNGVEVDITNLQFVLLDDDDLLIFAENEAQAATANLYQAVFGRTADVEGLEFWWGALETHETVVGLAAAFLASEEYGDPDLSNSEFIAELYENALGRTADTEGAAFWTAALDSGASRAGVVAEFALVATNHDENNETQVVGSVTIVEGILG